MDAKNLRPVPGGNCGQRSFIAGFRRGDIGRQQVAGAAAARRRRHPGDGGGIRRVIEHHSTGAVDLKIDEAGGDDVEFSIDISIGNAGARRANADNLSGLDLDKLVGQRRTPTARIQHGGPDRVTVRHVCGFRHHHPCGLPTRCGPD